MNLQVHDIGDMLSNGDLEDTIQQAKKESMDMQNMLDQVNNAVVQ
jgi:hypothetical protein